MRAQRTARDESFDTQRGQRRDHHEPSGSFNGMADGGLGFDCVPDNERVSGPTLTSNIQVDLTLYMNCRPYGPCSTSRF